MDKIAQKITAVVEGILGATSPFLGDDGLIRTKGLAAPTARV